MTLGIWSRIKAMIICWSPQHINFDRIILELDGTVLTYHFHVNLRVQTLVIKVDRYYSCVLTKAKLESRAFWMHFWPNDLRFVLERCCPRGSLSKKVIWTLNTTCTYIWLSFYFWSATKLITFNLKVLSPAWKHVPFLRDMADTRHTESGELTHEPSFRHTFGTPDCANIRCIVFRDSNIEPFSDWHCRKVLI